MPDYIEWMRLTAEELRARAEADALVIVPVASLEQHGPHLATGVDIVLATAVAERVARRMAEAGAPVVVTPTVWTGLAEHHMAFGGTVTLDYDAFAAVLRGILRSAHRCGFRRAMLLNGHGGNAEAVAVAATSVSTELGMKVAAGTYWHLIGDAFAPILERQSNVMHACEAETSMMLALRPDSVRRERLPEAHGPASTRVEGQPPTLALRRSFRRAPGDGGEGRAPAGHGGGAHRGDAGERGALALTRGRPAEPCCWSAGGHAPSRRAGTPSRSRAMRPETGASAG